MLLRLVLMIFSRAKVAFGLRLMEALARLDYVNQLDQFTENQTHVQRILAISSSTTSIVFCLASFYLFLAIDPRRLVFRHHLVFFLLAFDFIKATVLLLYPARVLTSHESYFNYRFCQVVGFFTATAIEGADLAILTFAIHTYLLIFKPSLNVRVGDSRRIEGGLYRFRWFIYPLCFVIPLVLASLAFISSDGYDSFVCWCYLPQRPVWYRLVLSWVPRWSIIVVVFSFYGLIYYHVIREYRVVGGVLTTLHRSRLPPNLQNDKPSFFSALRYFLWSVRDYFTPKFMIPDDQIQPATSNIAPKQTHGHSASTCAGDLSPTNNRAASVDTRVDALPDDNDDLDSSDDDLAPFDATTRSLSPPPAPGAIDHHDLHFENLKAFKKRQRVIEKQMKSIFVYPLAYVFIWLFPFILYVTQINYELHHGPVYWLNCMGAFMQPFNGFVDSLVFFYRETPWKYTVMNKFARDHVNIMDQVMRSSGVSKEDSMGSSEHYHQTLTESFAVDMSSYKWWRRLLNRLNFPLFQLPTEANLEKLQHRYLRSPSLGSDHTRKLPPHFSAMDADGLQGHDFSNILGGSLAENEFRSTLEGFSLNFNKKNSVVSQSSHRTHRSSDHSHQSVKRKGSVRSTKSRQFSVIDPNAPVIFEGKPFDSKPDVSPNSNKRPSVSSGNTLSVHRRRGNSGSSTPRKVSKATLDNRSSSTQNEEPDSEMDFLEFLKKGGT